MFFSKITDNCGNISRKIALKSKQLSSQTASYSNKLFIDNDTRYWPFNHSSSSTANYVNIYEIKGQNL